MISALAACSSNTGDIGGVPSYTQQTQSNADDSSSEAEPQSKGYFNNLTGCYVEGSKDKEDLRPVAVMINNLTKAQKVQTGLADASIIYETFVEGGITRLLAVFKDVSTAGELGSVRSARYSYVDLANGHDALYFHCGLDTNYCKNHMNSLKLDNIDINTGKYGKYGYRVSNGLAREHTMYTTGELVAKALSDNGRRTTKSDSRSKLYSSWQNFADENEVVTLTGGSANKLSIFFSSSYVTNFTYDSELGKYMKTNKSGNNTDYRTGENLYFENVLILFTTVGYFDDNYRLYSKLDGGSGYYCTNGNFMKIKWTKGDSYDPIRITDENGNSVKYSAGNSYVCIANQSSASKTTIS